MRPAQLLVATIAGRRIAGAFALTSAPLLCGLGSRFAFFGSLGLVVDMRISRAGCVLLRWAGRPNAEPSRGREPGKGTVE